MELEFDVKMTPAAMYDYLLHHTYSGMSGIVGAIAGAFCIIVFAANKYPIYLIAGIIILAYLPISLFLKANQQVQGTPAFKKPLHYKMTEEGITVSQDGNEEMQSWDACYKAVSTRSSIILYTSKTTASIFPKKDLGEKKDSLIQMISTHMPPNKVKIRF
ncbi:MAG: YcxB family protein [Lachnospiraceae bacterium]|nr:YcxB family protein [Lachnospiraceae bacterium]